MGNEISSFSGDFRFLSNFSHSPITVDGKEYLTVEHAYQAAKTAFKKHGCHYFRFYFAFSINESPI